MRLFIAINFKDETCFKLLTLQDELRGQSERGKFTVLENLHLTLVFLGECDDMQSESVKAAMDAISFEPFPVTIDRVGRFKRDRGDIWWAGVKENRSLLELRMKLTDELTKFGILLEKFNYNPHITLGRDIHPNISSWTIERFGESVNQMELMKSEQIGGRLTYTSIYQKQSTDL